MESVSPAMKDTFLMDTGVYLITSNSTLATYGTKMNNVKFVKADIISMKDIAYFPDKYNKYCKEIPI